MKALFILLSVICALNSLSVNGNVYETDDAIIVEAAIETDGMYWMHFYIYCAWTRSSLVC